MQKLNESPIHFIDSLKNFKNYDEEIILTLIGFKSYILKLEKMNNFSIKNIANSSANQTFNAIVKEINNLSNIDKRNLINIHSNYDKIKNELKFIERKLLQIYKDAGIQVHNDL